MIGSRRQVLHSVFAALGAVCLRPRPLAAEQGLTPRFGQPKNPPERDPTTKTLLAEQNQRAIKKDVQRLFDLATQLKTEVEEIDSTAVLSLPMVKKAAEIETLAKQIKKHATG